MVEKFRESINHLHDCGFTTVERGEAIVLRIGRDEILRLDERGFSLINEEIDPMLILDPMSRLVALSVVLARYGCKMAIMDATKMVHQGRDLGLYNILLVDHRRNLSRVGDQITMPEMMQSPCLMLGISQMGFGMWSIFDGRSTIIRR